MEHSESQLILANSKDCTIGIRGDQVLSFTYAEADRSLSIRYIGGSAPEKFDGAVAEILVRELRYCGRR
jgi:hypothetical protein